MASQFLETGVLVTMQSCILILFVLALRSPVARWLGARWAYRLWLLPVLCLFAALIPKQTTHELMGMPAIHLPAADMVYAAASRLNADILMGIWLFGFGASLLYSVFCNLQFYLKWRRKSRELSFDERAIISQRCAPLGRRWDIEFRLLSTCEGPAIAGVFRPALILPGDFFSRFDTQQQTLMLNHELQHLRRQDLIAQLVTRLYRCMFWFNPLAWIAERSMKLDQELSCDECVLSKEAPSTRYLYGKAMLLSAQQRPMHDSAAYHPPFNQLKQRTSLLRHHRSSLVASTLGLFLLVGSTIGAVSLGALTIVAQNTDTRPELEMLLSATRASLNDPAPTSSSLARLRAQLESTHGQEYGTPLTPFEKARVLLLSGEIALISGDYEQALKAFEQAVPGLRGEPGMQADALLGVARAQFSLNHQVETLKALVRSARIDPHPPSAAAWALRSEAWAAQMNWQKGLTYITRAIEQAEINGTQPQANWLLAQAAYRLETDDAAGAEASLEKLTTLYPETDAQEALEAIHKLLRKDAEADQSKEIQDLF